MSHRLGLSGSTHHSRPRFCTQRAELGRCTAAGVVPVADEGPLAGSQRDVEELAEESCL